MTHSTVSRERESLGSMEAVVHTIDITSLDRAGEEDYDPSTEVNIPNHNETGVAVVGQVNKSIDAHYNHTNQTLDIRQLDDGTDSPNNSDPGEMRLLVHGGGA